MARRLVEAGVRFVTLTYGGWDLHNGIADGIAEPAAAVRPGVRGADHATCDQRGLLDRRWSWCRSEFGRTPKINGTAGRDHWPKVFSVVLAGGGIKKGFDLRHVGRDRQRAGRRRR